MEQHRKEFLILVLISLFVISARMNSISLRSLDDCFYARKGVELGRSGRFFTVTWNYHPTFQNPPLQFWILGRSFAIFGENDFAARLPSLFMAVGILVCTYRIGMLSVGPLAAACGVAFLMISPNFMSNARRCMLEIPLTFWICLAVWILLEGIKRPKLHLLFGLPLAGAILTKSLLGLLPVWILLIAAGLGVIRNKHLIVSTLTGLMIGASWTLHEWSVFGAQPLREHYLGEIAGRSSARLPTAKLLFGYPQILLTVFQPVILPAVAGTIRIFKKLKENKDPGLIILIIWILFPVLFYNLSGTRSSRYLFPIFPALALTAGYWLVNFSSRFATLFRRWLVPAVLVIFGFLLWIQPTLLLKDENHELKFNGRIITKRIGELQSLPYLGAHFWEIANPLLYYCDRSLATSSNSAADVLKTGRKTGMLIVDRSRLPDMLRLAPAGEVILQSEDWALLVFSESNNKVD